MNEKLRKLLLSLGVSSATIKKYETDDATALEALKPDDDATEVKTRMKTDIESDDVFLQKVHQQENAKARTSIEKKLLKIHPELQDKYDELEPNKKLDFLLTEHDKKLKSSDNKDIEKFKKDNAELNDQLAEYKKKVKEYDEVVIPAKDKANTDFQKGLTINHGLMMKIDPNKVVIKNLESASKIVHDYIGTKGRLDLDTDGKTIVVKAKDKDALLYDKENNPYTLESMLTEAYTETGILRQSNGDQGGGTGGDGIGGNGGGDGGAGTGGTKFELPGLKKAIDNDNSYKTGNNQ